MVTTLCVKLQRTSIFFLFKSYFINVSYMDFTQNQVQSYRKNLPEKGKILKQSCFSVISYLFCSRQLCKYNLTTHKKKIFRCSVKSIFLRFQNSFSLLFILFNFKAPLRRSDLKNEMSSNIKAWQNRNTVLIAR